MKFYQGMAIALCWKKVQGVAMQWIKITQQHDKKNKLEKYLEEELEKELEKQSKCHGFLRPHTLA